MSKCSRHCYPNNSRSATPFSNKDPTIVASDEGKDFQNGKAKAKGFSALAARASLAQLVEHSICNRTVVGSSPTTGSISPLPPFSTWPSAWGRPPFPTSSRNYLKPQTTSPANSPKKPQTPAMQKNLPQRNRLPLGIERGRLPHRETGQRHPPFRRRHRETPRFSISILNILPITVPFLILPARPPADCRASTPRDRAVRLP